MASTFRLKRKTFSAQPKVYRLQRVYSEEDGQKKGLSTGAKVALGTAATLGTAALSFAGAKKGMFGTKAMLGANKMWGNAGKTLSNMGMKSAGEKMMLSGAQGVGSAVEKGVSKNLTNVVANAKGGGMHSQYGMNTLNKTTEQIQATAKQAGNTASENFLNKLLASKA